ncbi:flagellar basal-body MS-ring/collar protein FliF [Paracoccus marinus]|uniref:flagellar basal-body MS-ring/collar protein FliF n=1 Tax=Paracoccus marinus TaxID=288426 RepID=UPI00103DD618|nr:flagellar basal-body MS-ring/collar protein FliF [Paracoccus marinus]
MQKLLDYWTARSASQRVTLIAAFALTFLAVAGFAWASSRTDMALLYGGLDGAQSGEIMEEVEKSGVPYQVRGDSIWVDAARRDQLRMTLAGLGLPNAGGAGYEILDGMSGFGTTSQMFDAAYWRAKEGELARTILALPNVKTARVHLAVPSGRGYRREVAGTASVTLTTNGAPVERAQAQALRFLVSSGVPGMTPDRVTVIDSVRGVVAAADELGPADRESDLKTNVQRMLESHVGPGNAIVELNIAVQTEAESLTEQRFDPSARALVSQESQETSDNSTNQSGGPVTASSNLPEGGDAADAEQNRASSSETRQVSNYEVSRTTREVVTQPGATRRLTVAVMVNGVPGTDPQGEATLVPRAQAELDALRELVASAVGFDEARGDVITVKSLPFAALSGDGTLAERAGPLDRLDPNSLIRLALVGLFALVIAAVVLRPVLRGRAEAKAAPLLLDDSGPAVPGLPAPAAPIGMAMASGVADLPGLPAISIAGPDYDFTPPPAQAADPVARLRELMRERQQDSLRILSGWIDDKEKA